MASFDNLHLWFFVAKMKNRISMDSFTVQGLEIKSILHHGGWDLGKGEGYLLLCKHIDGGPKKIKGTLL